MILSHVKALASHNGDANLTNLNEYLWKAALSDIFLNVSLECLEDDKCANQKLLFWRGNCKTPNSSHVETVLL